MPLVYDLRPLLDKCKPRYLQCFEIRSRTLTYGWTLLWKGLEHWSDLSVSWLHDHHGRLSVLLEAVTLTWGFRSSEVWSTEWNANKWNAKQSQRYKMMFVKKKGMNLRSKADCVSSSMFRLRAANSGESSGTTWVSTLLLEWCWDTKIQRANERYKII